ncbi:hypothetical protein FIM08_01160 [SAR202 cluster bacterium AC-647-N09_OGT_505m]|nr:hypothetical protein [SAR202 cluster bacterium AC-647-N09_OGT_505m]
MNHAHMHSYTSIQAEDNQLLTDVEALCGLVDSIVAQELALGRSVEWTGNIENPQTDANGHWIVYTRALAITGNGSDGTPCSDRADTLMCEEFKHMWR